VTEQQGTTTHPQEKPDQRGLTTPGCKRVTLNDNDAIYCSCHHIPGASEASTILSLQSSIVSSPIPPFAAGTASCCNSFTNVYFRSNRAKTEVWSTGTEDAGRRTGATPSLSSSPATGSAAAMRMTERHPLPRVLEEQGINRPPSGSF